MNNGSSTVTWVSSENVIQMCELHMKEIRSYRDDYKERYIKNFVMTRHLFNWFPAKTREQAIKRLKKAGRWDEINGYGQEYAEYESMLHMAKLSTTETFMVSIQDFDKFRILDKGLNDEMD